MNPVKLTGGEVELKRPTTRLETERGPDPNVNTAAKTTGALKPVDSVSVSARASEIGALTAKTEQLPDVRAERVAELKAKVDSGDYNPPAAAIADALLKDLS